MAKDYQLIPLNSLNTKPMGLKTHLEFNVAMGVQIITRAILLLLLLDVVSCFIGLALVGKDMVFRFIIEYNKIVA
jgi:hypothetical protein